MDMLPDEIVAEIVLHVAVSLEEKVSLSMVCGRFRNILMSIRKLWEDYRLSNFQTPEEVMAIAEGQGFRSLKAFISEEADRGHLNVSSRLIMALRPAIVELELEFFHLRAEWRDEMGQSLRKSEWPVLQTLKTCAARSPIYLREFSEEFALFKGAKMPKLQNMVTTISPGAPLAGRLLYCKLNLVNMFLDLYQLLPFLSSVEALRELEVIASNVRCAPNYVHYIARVDIPNLETFSLAVMDDLSFQFAFLLIEKTNMPALRRLRFKTEKFLQSDIVLRIGQQILFPFPQIRELELELIDVDAARLAQVLLFVPIEVRTILIEVRFGYGEYAFEHSIEPGAFRRHRLRCVQFKSCEGLDHSFMKNAVDFLRRNGLVELELNVSDCANWKDGRYTLDTVCSAFTSQSPFQ